jgi:hypothetical protein
MEIVENLDRWRADFEKGWLALYESTGEKDWSIYNRPRNREWPGGPGVDLSQSRLLLISTAGSYLKTTQEPFDDVTAYGDYSIRTYPCSTSFDDLDYSHGHYDYAAVQADPEVLVPLDHLRALTTEGRIGELTENLVSLNGYMPEVDRLVAETVPLVLETARKERAHAALLVPA